MILLQTADYSSALSCLEKQLRLTPDSGYAYNNIAWCQLRLGKAEEAMGSCQEALRLLGTHSHVHHDYASILFTMGRFDEALSVIEYALANLKPAAPQLHYLGARVFEKQGRQREAVSAWKEYCYMAESHCGHHRAVGRALERLEILGDGLPVLEQQQLLAKTRPSQVSVGALWELVGLRLPEEKHYLPKSDKKNHDLAKRTAERG